MLEACKSCTTGLACTNLLGTGTECAPARIVGAIARGVKVPLFANSSPGAAAVDALAPPVTVETVSAEVILGARTMTELVTEAGSGLASISGEATVTVASSETVVIKDLPCTAFRMVSPCVASSDNVVMKDLPCSRVSPSALISKVALASDSARLSGLSTLDV